MAIYCLEALEKLGRPGFYGALLTGGVILGGILASLLTKNYGESLFFLALSIFLLVVGYVPKSQRPQILNLK